MAIQVRRIDGVVIVVPHGKIVGSKVLEFKAALLPEAKAYDYPRILINLAHATGMNSSGLGVLMQAHGIVKHKNGRMGVIHVGKHINNLLVLSRLASLFEHFDNETQAIAALSEE